MLFLNTALLLGALGILIPILIHLLNRRSSKVVEWGAMNFLLESLAIRNRRIQLEEALLMATRCLVVGLLALALARPFVPPGSTIPWLLVLPVLLLAVVGLGVTTVLHSEPKWRRRIGGVSILLLLLCVAMIAFEKYLNLSRFSPGARQDIALIVDASTSMSTARDGITNFERAIDEARTLIKRAPRGHAFSIIQGGPSPGGIRLEPTTDRADLEAALDELAPLDGAMTTYQAFTLASLSLARGDNPAKQIVILTDGQNVGWEIGQSGRWNFLRDAFQNLASVPQIMVREMPLPDYIRNLAVTEIRLSRDIVGVDRPVEVTVSVENTGNEAVTPGALVLTLDDGRVYRDESLGQLRPGERQSTKFFHQFSEAGAHSFSAELEVSDDILRDNRSDYAVNVADELRVLIVDGRPGGNRFERASTFPAIALAPSSLTLNPNLEANLPGVSDESSDDFNLDYDPTLDPIRFLVSPTVLDASAIGTIDDFSNYDAIILADVARLPSNSAVAIADFVESGGGLLVAAGQKAQPDFYNSWVGSDETQLLPTSFADRLTIATGDDIFSPSTQTLTHPALAKIADAAKSDLASTSISNYRNQTIPDIRTNETSIGARLNNGDILLSSREVGDGTIIAMGIPLDLSSGNLVTRQAFLPLVHELVYHLADPAAYDLNLDPGWEVNVNLTGKKGQSIGEGLIGRYYPSHTAEEPLIKRQDSSIAFDWRGDSPAIGIPPDNFRIEWTGQLEVPKTEKYTFSGDIDDYLEIWIDGKRIGDIRNNGNRRLSLKLEAGKPHEFRAIYREDSGEAGATLYWEAKGIPREPIPSQAFRAFSDSAKNGELASYEVTGPDDRARTAQLSTSQNGTVFTVRGQISSGLYRFQVPEKEIAFFSDFLQTDSTTIPFTVKRDPAESQLVALTDADYEFLANFVTLSRPQTLDELIGFLNGNQFGQELWKYLALGALFFLLIEIALTRWIARSRRMGEEIQVKFESKDSPTSAFHELLGKMGKGVS